MIGRGALRNPGIFEEIRGGINHPTATKINRLIDLSDLLIESCTQANPDQGYALSRLKGHWEYFCEDLEEGKQLQRKLKKAKSIQQFIQEINSF
jgi:tRNA-dihydrouridine synthase B